MERQRLKPRIWREKADGEPGWEEGQGRADKGCHPLSSVPVFSIRCEGRLRVGQELQIAEGLEQLPRGWRGQPRGISASSSIKRKVVPRLQSFMFSVRFSLVIATPLFLRIIYL